MGGVGEDRRRVGSQWIASVWVVCLVSAGVGVLLALVWRFVGGGGSEGAVIFGVVMGAVTLVNGLIVRRGMARARSETTPR